LDAVELAAGQQRDEDRVDARALIAAQEEPVLAPEDLATEVLLGHIVVEREAAVLEESGERGALIAGVPDGLRDRRLIEDDGGLFVAPGEEGIDDGPGFLAAGILAFFAGCRPDRALDPVESTDQRERMLGTRGVGAEGLVEVPPTVGPASDLD